MPFSCSRQDLARRPVFLAGRGLALAALLIAPLALGGCSMFGSSDDDTDADIEAAAPQPCPTVGVLDGADRVTVFNGRGRDLTDVVLRAEIRKAVTQCKYDTDEHTISVDLAFDGLAEMGPAAASRDQTLKGFVAITRTDGKIVNKQEFDMPVTFDGATRQVRFEKVIEDSVVPYGGTVNGSIYQFLVGFQLTHDQLEYNRKVPQTPLK
ncbi:MAG TPA: hypothetical protein VF449_00435 [Parvibaculum sp.]